MSEPIFDREKVGMYKQSRFSRLIQRTVWVTQATIEYE